MARRVIPPYEPVIGVEYGNMLREMMQDAGISLITLSSEIKKTNDKLEGVSPKNLDRIIHGGYPKKEIRQAIMKLKKFDNYQGELEFFEKYQYRVLDFPLLVTMIKDYESRDELDEDEVRMLENMRALKRTNVLDMTVLENFLLRIGDLQREKTMSVLMTLSKMTFAYHEFDLLMKFCSITDDGEKRLIIEALRNFSFDYDTMFRNDQDRDPNRRSLTTDYLDKARSFGGEQAKISDDDYLKLVENISYEFEHGDVNSVGNEIENDSIKTFDYRTYHLRPLTCKLPVWLLNAIMSDTKYIKAVFLLKEVDWMFLFLVRMHDLAEHRTTDYPGIYVAKYHRRVGPTMWMLMQMDQFKDGDGYGHERVEVEKGIWESRPQKYKGLNDIEYP